MMVLDPEATRQHRTGRNPDRAGLEFKDAVAGATAKMMVMPTVRRLKVWFFAREQDFNDRSGLAQQANRAVDGRQSKTRHARTAALEDRRNIQRPLGGLDDLENRFALPGVACGWRDGAHSPRISLGK